MHTNRVSPSGSAADDYVSLFGVRPTTGATEDFAASGVPVAGGWGLDDEFDDAHDDCDEVARAAAVEAFVCHVSFVFKYGLVETSDICIGRDCSKICLYLCCSHRVRKMCVSTVVYSETHCMLICPKEASPAWGLVPSSQSRTETESADRAEEPDSEQEPMEEVTYIDKIV